MKAAFRELKTVLRIWPHLLKGIFPGRHTEPNVEDRAEIEVVDCGWFELTRIHLDLDPPVGGAGVYRIAHLSDIHMDGNMTGKLLGEVVDRVMAERPDLAVLTGDFVTHSPERFRTELIEPLRRLTPAEGALAVLGNHDHWSGPEVVCGILAEAGVRVLQNEVVTLAGGRLHVAGVDDHMARQDCLECVLGQVPEGGTALLLAHEPDFAQKSGPSGRFALQLSGHSHGGQINLPRLGPIFLPGHAHKYPCGLYQISKMLLYTSRGLGAVHLPWRLGSKPEVVVYDIA